MKKCSLLLFITCITMVFTSFAKAQSLADVLSSIQERHLFIKQRNAMNNYLRAVEENRRINFYRGNQPPVPLPNPDPFPAGDDYIAWSEGGHFPTKPAGSNMKACVLLLNEAVKAVDEIKSEFINISSDRLAKAEANPGIAFAQGSFFSELDLPSVGLVTSTNYRWKLQLLAMQVNALRVTWWPVITENHFRRDSSDGAIEGSTPPKALSNSGEVNIPEYPYSFQDRGSLFDSSYVTASQYKDSDGEKDDSYSFETIQTYTIAVETSLYPKGANLMAVASGHFLMLQKWGYSNFTNRAVGGLRQDQNPDSPAIHLLPGSSFFLSRKKHPSGRRILPINAPDFSIAGFYDRSSDFDSSMTSSQYKFVPEGASLAEMDLDLESPPTFSIGEDSEGYSHLHWDKDEGFDWSIYQRRLQGIMIGSFYRGLDRANNRTIGKLTMRPVAQPDCSIKILPEPAVLMEIPLGAGATGPSTARLTILNPRVTDRGVSRELYDTHGRWLAPISDGPDPGGTAEVISPLYSGRKMESGYPSLASDLRFTGPREDFVVIASNLVPSNGNAQLAPEWRGRTYHPHRGWFAADFLRAWHRAPLRQIIGRQVIADLTPAAHRFGTTIRLFHRDPSSPLPGDGMPVDVSSLNSFATYTISSGAGLVNGFPSSPFGLKISRSGGAPTTEYHFSTPGAGNNYQFDRYYVSVRSGGAEVEAKRVDFDRSANTISFTELESNRGGVTTISNLKFTKDLSTSTWYPKDLADPNCLTTILKSGASDNPVVTTFFPNSRFPTAVGISRPNGPNSSKSWDVGGFPAEETSGAWTESYSSDGGGYQVISKLAGSAYRRTWVSWTDEGATVTVNSAPVGSIADKTHSSVATTIYSFEKGDHAFDGALPWGLVKINSPGSFGTTIGYQNGGNHSLLVATKTGKLGSFGVTAGQSSVRTINRFGFVQSQTDSILPNLITGGWTSTGSLSSWGSPQFIDPKFPTGLPNARMTWDSGIPSISSTTSSLGLNVSLSNRDWRSRPRNFAWDGHMGGTIAHNAQGLNSSIQIDGRTKGYSYRTNLNGDLLSASTVGNHSTSHDYRYEGTAQNRSVIVDTSNAAFGLTQVSKYHQDSGALLSLGGNANLAKTAGLVVDSGMLKRSVALADTPGAFRHIWTDAWGRVRKVETPPSRGGTSGNEETIYEYSPPGTDISRVIVKSSSGRWLMSEFEPFPEGGRTTAGQKSVARQGIDVNKSGTLGAGDRFLLTETINGASVTTKVSRTVEGSGNPEMQEVSTSTYNIATGGSTTNLNEGEEVITSDLRLQQPIAGGAAYQVHTNSTKAWQVTKNFDHKGLLLSSVSSGRALPDSSYAPTWHADGSLTSATTTVGGNQTKATYAPSGAVTGFVDPVLGSHAVSSVFGFGSAFISIPSLNLNSSFSFDGTRSEITGENVVDERRTSTPGPSGFTSSIKALEVDQTTSFSASPSGTITSKNFPAGNGQSMTWKAGGLPWTVSLARGGLVIFQHKLDGARDLTSVRYPAVAGSSFLTESMTYGADGNPKSISDRSGTRSLTWNRDRLESVEYAADGKILAGYQVDPRFDGLGRKTGVVLRKNGSRIHNVVFHRNNGTSGELTGVAADWVSISHVRDPVNRWITQVKRTKADLYFTRDAAKAGRLTRVSSGVTGAPNFQYRNFDRFGRRKTVLSNRGNWTYEYGANGQLTNARNQGVPDFSYAVDAIGRRTKFMSNGDGGQPDQVSIDLNQPVGHFGVNKFDLKLEISGATGSKFYLTDPFTNKERLFPGNKYRYSFLLDQRAGGIDRYIYGMKPGRFRNGGWYPWAIEGVLENQGDIGAHPDAVSAVEGLTWINPSSGSYSHDADGNRQSAPGWRYFFDGRNRLFKVQTDGFDQNPFGTKLEFEYDAEGRRVQKIISRKNPGLPGKNSGSLDVVSVDFVWDGWNLLYECHRNDRNAVILERRYLWGVDLSGSVGGAGGAGGLMSYQQVRNGITEVFYPLYDGSGNVVGMADGNGDLVAEYRYGPFGELISATGPKAAENPWRFATKYEDPETRLVYFGHRYFDPVTGNWLSREPLGESESLNLYAYCHGDPINKVDVLGLAEIPLNWSDPNFDHRTPLQREEARANASLKFMIMVGKMQRNSSTGAGVGLAEGFFQDLYLAGGIGPDGIVTNSFGHSPEFMQLMIRQLAFERPGENGPSFNVPTYPIPVIQPKSNSLEGSNRQLLAALGSPSWGSGDAQLASLGAAPIVEGLLSGVRVPAGILQWGTGLKNGSGQMARGWGNAFEKNLGRWEQLGTPVRNFVVDPRRGPNWVSSSGSFGAVTGSTLAERSFLSNVHASFGGGSVFTGATRHSGNIVIQRSDIPLSIENLRRMQAGNSPFVRNAAGEWETLNLHHIGRQDGKLIEIFSSHNTYNPTTGGVLHIPGPGGPLRQSRLSQTYWQRRLNGFIDAGVIPGNLLEQLGR